MSYFEAYRAGDVPSFISCVPVSALIAGDTSGLVTPLYGPGDCPVPTFLVAQTYVPSAGPSLRIPIYSSRLAMQAPYARATAALTSGPAVP